MKKRIFIIVVIFTIFSSAFCQKKLPFSKGVNLLDYFELWEYKQDFLPFYNKYDEADFACMKSMGIDVVRLPIHFDLLQKPKYTGRLSISTLEQIDKVVALAEKYQIYLVLDDHSYNEESSNPPSIKDMREHLTSVWQQVAARYKNESQYIIYEIINEPPYTSGNNWYKLQKEIVDLIRTYDKKHSIVVSCLDFSRIEKLVQMKPLDDNNLIYAFHYYEPHLFTHQGATWMGPGFAEASGIPFPYERSRFPKLKVPENTWFKQLVTEYPQTGTVKYMENRVKKAVDWAAKYNVAIWCGECGIQARTQNPDRAAYNKILTDILAKYNIPYCTWGLDYQCGFFSKDEPGMLFPDDIDKEMVESYGFNMPSAETVAKTNASIKNFPEESYVLYDGVFGKWADFQIWGWGCIKNTVDDLAHGDCLVATYSKPNAGPDTKIFLPKGIVNKLEENKDSVKLSFSVKFTDKKQEFTIHIMDSDGGSALPPWRNSVMVRAADYSINEWVTIELPLSEFNESGAWTDIDKKWFNPQNKFDWNRVDWVFFEFYNNQNEYSGDVYVDDIVLKKL